MNEKTWSKEALELVNKQLNEIRNEVIFETKSGKKYHIKESGDSYICSRNNQNVDIPKYWVNELALIYNKKSRALDVILTALEHEWYVATEWRFTTHSTSIPVHGCNSEEECHEWVAKLFGNGWEIVHHAPII